ncbi:MAG: cell envelope integrity protein CreD [Cyclobacteriaceae bacterium]|nr:cell envelope integrity protein CreD [Cyclobacteriaceae bacterium]
MKEEMTIFERVNSWIKNSFMLKLFIITILMLLLLIPSAMIQSIITEREGLSNAAIEEVSAKWARSQQINGPILTIPLIYEYMEDGKLEQTTRYWYILPETLNIKGKVEPEKLRRNIYEIVVYESKLTVAGNFLFDKTPDKENLKAIQYNKAFLTIGISDLKGIKDQIVLNWNNKPLKVEPGSRVPNLIYSGVTIALPFLEEPDSHSIPFSFDLNLHGSQNLSFVPIGSTTKVTLNSDWPSPSFNGNFLPNSREITATGFTADWKVLQLNRNFPQSWTGSVQDKNLESASFGVNLILPLDDYQKSMRSAKYAAMTIALTFLIFFLVEILNGKKIHPFQYILVGLALSLFYILLISISEHSNFNLAYAISTLSIVGMITLYSLSIFKASRLTMLLVVALLGIYGFLFVTLQLADYALLMGSIGLTLILAATMYFTRNINWYQLNKPTE